MAPANMRGLNVPDVPKKDFVCNGKVTLTQPQRLFSLFFFLHKYHAEALSSHVLFNGAPETKEKPNME